MTQDEFSEYMSQYAGIQMTEEVIVELLEDLGAPDSWYEALQGLMSGQELSGFLAGLFYGHKLTIRKIIDDSIEDALG